VSNGRFLFGIGGGWIAEEMADHGVEFKDRFRVTRERVLAMKEIWTKEVAEYHGKFVNFDPMCSQADRGILRWVAPPGCGAEQWPVLERYAALIRKFV
jgi:alkanesulfonate monooxygenase SsuD/methylene tetrahydromethanopterin reductase-like flavin-dependent oxidoreductase (luciferase family)